MSDTKPAIANRGEISSVQTGAQSAVAAPEKQAEGTKQEEKIITDEKPPMDEEKLKEYFQSAGIEFNGIDDLKEKLKPKEAAKAEPTPEEIAAKEKAFEKRQLDLYLKTEGASIETFAKLKQAKEADVAEMSKALLHAELISQGYDEDEAKAIQKQMYLQEDLDALQFDEDGEETKEEFEKKKAKLEKKVQYGAGLLANRSLHIKTTAQSFFDNLKQEIELEDADAARETQYSTEVETYVKTLPKSIALSIGKVDNKDIEPIAIAVPETVHQEVSALLGDRQKREEFFFDANGNLNLKNIADLLVRSKVFENAGKEGYLKGGTAQVNIIKQVFPYEKATDLGIGGSAAKNPNDKPKVAQRGTPQRV